MSGTFFNDKREENDTFLSARLDLLFLIKCSFETAPEKLTTNEGTYLSGHEEHEAL